MALTKSQLKARESKIVGYTSESSKQSNISSGAVSSSSKAASAPVISATPTTTKTTSSTTKSSSGSSSSPVIKNQGNITSNTSSLRSSNNESTAKLDSLTGEKTAKFGDQGQYTYKINAQGQPYGAPISTDTTVTDTTKEDKTLPEGDIQDSLGNKYYSSTDEDISYKLPTLDEGKKWVYDKSGKAYEMDSTGKITTNTVADEMYNENLQQQETLDAYNKLWDDRKESLDTTHTALIDSIKEQATQQTAEMEKLNTQYLGAKKVAGFRTGGTEYTPEIAMGILKNEEEEGLQRITDIDLKSKLLIAEAVQAKEDAEFEVLKSKLDTYTQLQKDKKTEIQNIYKSYIDNQKYIADTKKSIEADERATEDQALQNLTNSSEAYAKKYNSYTSSAAKKAYLNELSKSTGLSTDVLEGAIIKATDTPKASSTKTTNEDKVVSVSSMFDKNNTFKNTYGNTLPIIDENGYAEPEAFKQIFKMSGLSRTDFIKQFGYLIYLPNVSNYGLTPVEVKLLTGSTNKEDPNRP